MPGADAPPAAGPQARAPRTSLVGRREVITEIAAALPEHRLVTVLGPGGVGKTRVAAEVSARNQAWPDGVVWLDLTAQSPGGVFGLLAHALGLREARISDLSAGVVGAIGGRSLLVVLDNCEHVVDEAAATADELLAACPAAMLLATSREVLAVTGERAILLPPLSLATATQTPEKIMASDAVRLLEARAGAVVPGFRLTPEDAPDAARLCRRLDGLPLAIELAAARLRVLTLRQVADGVDDVFHLLVSRNRSAPARHHSLRAALDWSYDLLTPQEQQLLWQVSALPADFDLDAAAAVAGRSTVQVLDPLARLVDKCFVEAIFDRTEPGRPARYRLLETVRRYAAEHLATAGEERAVRDRLAAHFAGLAVATAPRLTSPEAAAALDLLDGELPNFDAAVRHLLSTGQVASALRLGGALWRLCYLRGHYRQGREWLDAAATAAGEDDGEHLVDVLHGAGVLAFLQCDYTAAVRRLERALDLARRLGDAERTAAALQMLGGVAREQGRYARAHELYTESETLYRQVRSPAGVARATNYLSFLSWLQCRWDDARGCGTVALEAFRRLGDSEGIIWALLNLGAVALLTGALGDAASNLADASERAAGVDFREGIGWTSHLLGLVANREGDPVGAARLLADAARAHGSLGDRWRLASVLADLACVPPADPAAAARLFGAADATWESIGSGPAPYERGRQDEGRDAARARLGDAAYAAAWREGRAAPVEELVGVAPAVLTVVDLRDKADLPTGADLPGGADLPNRAGEMAHRPSADEQVVLSVTALGAGRVLVGDREVRPADWGYAKPRELFFLLASCGPMTKERIGVTVWPDLDAAQLRGALHTALRDLRRALGGSGWIVYERGRYALATGPVRVDVQEFEAAVATARACRSAQEALPHLLRATDLYGGDLLPDVGADWVGGRRDALRQACTRALLAAGRGLAGAGRLREAAARLERAVELDPLLEAAHRDLMLCLVKAGEPGLALRQYEALAARLEADLGVSPSPQTRALAQKIRTRP